MKFKHFSPEKDPNMLGVADSTMMKLDAARVYANIPFVITCGRRTAEHNAELKGAVPDSAHIPDETGYAHALDLACTDDHDLFLMIEGLLQATFHRIGIYVIQDKENPNKLIPRHIHVDDDATKPPGVVFILIEQN